MNQRARPESDFRDYMREKFGAEGEQLDLAIGLIKMYDQRGLVSGRQALALHRHCDCRGKCWGGEPRGRIPPRNIAGISVPWIGGGYPETRTVVAGINQFEYGGLFAHWWVYSNLAQELGGGKQHKGSMVAYAVATYLTVLAEADHGQTESGAPDPTAAEIVRAWSRCAFLELVKCSPIGSRSKPNGEMWSNCLGEYLIKELNLLGARRLLVLGTGISAERVALLSEQVLWEKGDGGLQRGRLELDKGSVEVFCCDHPAYSGWRRSIGQLAASIQQDRSGL